LLHPQPRSVLIVGCGAGVTAGSFLKYPNIDKIVICEIEPLIPQVVAQYFGAENYNVVKDPRVKIVYDDARHYVFTTREKFDIITSDPIHPWVKGAATLYTREYFEMCKRHLNPGGLVTQWVPLYESGLSAVKSEVASFFAAFPKGTLWGNDEGGDGYDLVMLGQAEEMTIDLDAVQQRWEKNPAAEQSLDQVGFKSMLSLLSTYGGRASDLGPWLKGAEINHDRNLRLQYLAGISANYSQERVIYDSIIEHRRFPESLFAGSDERRTQLRKAISESRSK
jgi:spermidine synthase